MKDRKLKIILDTNIYISTFCFDGKIREGFKKILKKVSNDEILILVSDELLKEIEDKFKNGRIEKIMKEKYDSRLALEFLNNIYNITTITNPPASLKINSCRDPEDNMILELAVFEEVDYIVTGDRDLLVLNPFEYRNKEFGIDCKIEIVDIKEFVELLEG